MLLQKQEAKSKKQEAKSKKQDPFLLNFFYFSIFFFFCSPALLRTAHYSAKRVAEASCRVKRKAVVLLALLHCNRCRTEFLYQLGAEKLRCSCFVWSTDLHSVPALLQEVLCSANYAAAQLMSVRSWRREGVQYFFNFLLQLRQQPFLRRMLALLLLLILFGRSQRSGRSSVPEAILLLILLLRSCCSSFRSAKQSYEMQKKHSCFFFSASVLASISSQLASLVCTMQKHNKLQKAAEERRSTSFCQQAKLDMLEYQLLPTLQYSKKSRRLLLPLGPLGPKGRQR